MRAMLRRLCCLGAVVGASSAALRGKDVDDSLEVEEAPQAKAFVIPRGEWACTESDPPQIEEFLATMRSSPLREGFSEDVVQTSNGTCAEHGFPISAQRKAVKTAHNVVEMLELDKVENLMVQMEAKFRRCFPSVDLWFGTDAERLFKMDTLLEDWVGLYKEKYHVAPEDLLKAFFRVCKATPFTPLDLPDREIDFDLSKWKVDD